MLILLIIKIKNIINCKKLFVYLQYEFTPKDVEKPGLAQLLTTVIVKGQPMFFILEDFSDLKHYELIMGYDKPMDFGFEKSIESSEPVEEKIKVKKAN